MIPALLNGILNALTVFHFGPEMHNTNSVSRENLTVLHFGTFWRIHNFQRTMYDFEKKKKKKHRSPPLNLTLSGVYAYCSFIYKLANEKQLSIGMRPC